MAFQLATLVLAIDEAARSVPVDEPWTAGDASELDGQTLQTYLEGHGASPRLRELTAAATRALFGAEPR